MTRCPEGTVVGTEVDQEMVSAADAFVASEGLGNVALMEDDVFASDLEPASFDLVHARFLVGPLSRGDEQMASYLRLVRPGGTIVFEELDPGSWHFLPPAPALEQRLIPLLRQAFETAGGEPEGWIDLPRLFRDADIEPTVNAEVQALPPATRISGCRCSSPPGSTGCCASSSTTTNSTSCSTRSRTSCRTQAAGG